MAWDYNELRDIDRRISEAVRQSDVRHTENQYHFRSADRRLVFLERKILQMETIAKLEARVDQIESSRRGSLPAAIGDLVGTWWLRTAILLALLSANVSFEHSTKLLSLFR